MSYEGVVRYFEIKEHMTVVVESANVEEGIKETSSTSNYSSHSAAKCAVIARSPFTLTHMVTVTPRISLFTQPPSLDVGRTSHRLRIGANDCDCYFKMKLFSIVYFSILML